MKQSELCKRTKIPKSSLSLYLTGAYEPRQDRLYQIAIALDVDPVWLMGFDVPMERAKKDSSDKLALTEGEKLMLELFRKIPKEHQQSALEMLQAALKMQKKP
jgi:transcriptional regulator with XRE-family HTH domain